VRGSFDKDEIEGLADTWLVECGDKRAARKKRLTRKCIWSRSFALEGQQKLKGTSCSSLFAQWSLADHLVQIQVLYCVDRRSKCFNLAVALDINRGYISDVETGKREAGIITLQVIAKGLDTTMSNLLRGF
jgi:transcriptional regulator with XRE-family HTH domain